MNFSDALEALKAGQKITRKEWREAEKEDCIKLAEYHGKPCFLLYRSGNGRSHLMMTAWTPDRVEMLAEDWELVE